MIQYLQLLDSFPAPPELGGHGINICSWQRQSVVVHKSVGSGSQPSSSYQPIIHEPGQQRMAESQRVNKWLLSAVQATNTCSPPLGLLCSHQESGCKTFQES